MKDRKDINFMIYGANGYTGRIIAELSLHNGLRPILAGRRAEPIKKMAEKLQLEYEICDLNDQSALNDLALSTDIMLNCAGPFEHTVKPMITACMKSGCHYLDITGEISVFEYLASRTHDIEDAGIMALPGVGFDVVPSDCLAAYLKNRLPSATHLSLAFMGLGGGISHGTLTTMMQNITKGGAIRKDGKIVKVPNAYKVRAIPFGTRRPVLAATIPWGDVSTAYHSTGIPNIEVYMAVSRSLLSFLKQSNSMGWLLNRGFVKKFMQKMIDARTAGPTPEKRRKGKSLLWGEAIDDAGNRAAARIITPEGYTLTALTALTVVLEIMRGNVKPGFQTPSTAYGANFIMQIEGVTREDLGVNRRIDVG